MLGDISNHGHAMPFTSRRASAHLRRTHDPPLVFTPVHAEDFIPVTLQSSPGLHDELAQRLHLISHLVHCLREDVHPVVISANTTNMGSTDGVSIIVWRYGT